MVIATSHYKLVSALVLIQLAAGQSTPDDELAKALCSQAVRKREAALAELNRRRMKAGAKLDIEDKTAVFECLMALDSPNYVFRAAHFLAQLPMEHEILDRARRSIAGNKPDLNRLVAGLAYLEVRDPESFAAFVNSRKYKNHEPTIRGLFASSPAFEHVRETYCNQLVGKYLQWRSGGVADQANPFRENILAVGVGIVPYLNRALDKHVEDVDARNRLLWILGEFGDPRSFAGILRAYVAHPSPRAGIALGSCVGRHVESLFAAEMDESMMRRLLAQIYGGPSWKKVKDKSLADLKQHMLEHVANIVDACRKRSVPMQG